VIVVLAAYVRPLGGKRFLEQVISEIRARRVLQDPQPGPSSLVQIAQGPPHSR
jgi:hypothetical protein